MNKRRLTPTDHKQSPYVHDANALSGWRVIFCIPDDLEVSFMRQWTSDLGGVGIRTENFDTLMEFLARNAAANTVVVIGTDPSNDPDAIIDHCLVVRSQRAETPIVIASSKISLNDFSMDRAAICDASLRLPVSQSAFKLGIPAAIENNAAYRRRLADRNKEAAPSTSRNPEPSGERENMKSWDWPLWVFGVGAAIASVVWWCFARMGSFD